MIKASFGGGGRGMRVVQGPDDLEPRLEEAQREAEAAFGRPDVFLERYIPRAKHIEVQILGDAHGSLVHLWERDCSVQRRHQKVVEVAPSILDDDLRGRICDAAARLCRSVGYRNAGTVEFLLDVDRRRVLLHRGEPPHPGRAHRHRSGDRASIWCEARSSSPTATGCTTRR